MAIRDIVTRGFGNGTYSPGANDIPVRGYTTVGDPPTIPGAEYAVPNQRLHYAVPSENQETS